MNRNSFQDLPKISLYSYENFFNIYTDVSTNKNFYNLLVSVNIAPSNNEKVQTSYIVTESDTWISISYKFYNTIDLWWLVCVYNQIQNPTKLPAAGTTINLLKSEYVSTVLSILNKQLIQ